MGRLDDATEGLERWLEAHPRGRRALYVLLVGTLLFARLPERFLAPFLYAEEGTVYFRYAWHHGVWDSLTAVQMGYFMPWTNLATTLAAHAVRIEHAPIVTTALGTAIWVLLVALATSGAVPLSSHRARLVLVLLLLLIPPHGGKTHTSFSQYYLCFAALVVLASEPRTLAQRWILRGALCLAALNGIQCLFAAPLFVLRWLWGGRAREVRVWIAILVVCGALQTWAFLWARENRPGQFSELRLAAFEPLVWSGAVVVRSIVEPLFTTDGMLAFGGALRDVLTGAQRGPAWWAAAVGLPAAALLVHLAILGPRGSRSPRTGLLAAAYLAIGVVSTLGSMTGEEGTKSLLLVKHARYFVGPNLMLALALVIHASSPVACWQRRLYRVAVAWALVAGAITFFQDVPRLTHGPAWRTEIAAWRADPSDPIEFWPPGWRTRLRPETQRYK